MLRCCSADTHGVCRTRRLRALCTTVLLAFTTVFSANLEAGDWPQILGPNRNAIAVQETISLAWPGDQPPLLWQYKVGSGVAGVAVRDQQAIIFHRVDDQEVVDCLDIKSGNRRWTNRFKATFDPRIMPEDGPLCVPVILADKVLVHGAAGQLSCLNRKTGQTIWSVDTQKKFSFNEGYFGAGSTPIVYKNKVLLNVGGSRQEAGVVAFDLETGETVWKAGNWQASYAAPILTTVGDDPLAIFVTRLETVGLEPNTGTVRFSLPFGQRGPTVNGATPVVLNGHLFLTASYGIGNVWAKISANDIEVVRSDLEPLASQYTTPVVVNDQLIGVDGRQDGGPVDLVCFDPATGQESWREPGIGYATLIKAGDKLLIMKTDGELVIAAASTEKYTELKRTRLASSTCRALPALADGRLFVRDMSTLRCFDLSGN